jgi:hypothetical protein
VTILAREELIFRPADTLITAVPHVPLPVVVTTRLSSTYLPRKIQSSSLPTNDSLLFRSATNSHPAPRRLSYSTSCSFSSSSPTQRNEANQHQTPTPHSYFLKLQLHDEAFLQYPRHAARSSPEAARVIQIRDCERYNIQFSPTPCAYALLWSILSVDYDLSIQTARKGLLKQQTMDPT